MILHPRLLGAVREQLANERKPFIHKQLASVKRSAEQKVNQTRKQATTYEGRSPPISTQSNEQKP
ncbi:hypothetical protein ABE137_21970 [Brevibacillus laterosporus]|uniref:Uncharacterized protein n=2 Tax=Brevibacillus TaxID=55080 RepID=A0A0F7EFC1_BRELA|nr:MULTISPECIES: hypothetical protein [Brevibacillus]AKF93362.1 hypothetical protein EX87_06750 [Brevibacillus laterosporus]MCR8985730.1 hypothetical protein [Brevibacillus laterosporus]MCZ0831464.1 hypothetical protein [Brevibacillus halotolerans]GIO03228.1 hypothetical protein J5TS2_38960 [Brevibacillus halotolerans]